jgi:arylformamidase
MNLSSDILDISMPLHPGIPTWPGSDGIRILGTKRIDEGDAVNVSRIDCDLHVGTHVDAPWHFLKNGQTVDALSLDILIGPAVVLEIPEVALITSRELQVSNLSEGTERVLLRTRNSVRWARGVAEFKEDYTALSADAALWLARRRIRLIGIDYLSIQPFEKNERTHEILMRSNIAILEGLDLSRVCAGRYELICLPLKLMAVEGAPARAILRRCPDKREPTPDIGGAI